MKANNKYRLISLILISFITLSFSLASAQNKNMKILCYNILEGMKKDTTEGKVVFAEWIKAQDPDILALQEVNKFTQKKLEDLARSYGHPYAVLLKENGYPVALTSKYPIVNVSKVIDNMHHGFIQAKVADLNIIVLHLSPHKYWKRREEIKVVLETIASSPDKDKWMIMGDFNSLSPLDAGHYTDGLLLKRYQEAKKKYSFHENLIDNDSALDYSIHQAILEFGLVDGMLQDKSFSVKNEPKGGSRIDFIYVSKDLKNKVTNGGFITNDFTRYYSDHRPVYIELKADKK